MSSPISTQSPWPWPSDAPLPPHVMRGIGCDDRGLVVGAGTRLVRMGDKGRLAVEPGAARCIALLSVFSRRPIGAEVLRPIEAAAAYWAAGDKALANLRLVFAGLPKLRLATDAACLEAAAWCLDQGLAPRDLMKALDLDPSVLDFRKYDPNQPRVPAGSGRESGRWTTGGAVTSELHRSETETDSAHVVLAATTTNFKYACKKLGLDPNEASEVLHAAKEHFKIEPAENCVFDLENGDIFSTANI